MPRNPAPEIVGLGMSVLDLVQVVEAFPHEGGVTRVLEAAMMGGGPVPTALCAAARCGAKTAILDRVGDDWRGRLLREDYERFGVSTEHLHHESGRRSPFGTVLVRKADGERHLIYDEGDFTPLAGSELPREWLSRCRLLHLNGRHWPACLEAARIVREHGGLVSCDGGAHRYDRKFESLFPLVDLLIVAADFADRAVGAGERFDQLEALAQWGGKLVGITEGGKGSWFRDEAGNRFHQDAFATVQVVDTTGCGDVFHGVFLASALREESWESCARLASAAAALSATALGGRGFLPTREEAESLVTSSLANRDRRPPPSPPHVPPSCRPRRKRFRNSPSE